MSEMLSADLFCIYDGIF